MDAQRKRYIAAIVALAAAILSHASHADEPRSLKPAGVMIVTSEDAPFPSARSPYADWPDQGMRPLLDLQEQRNEIFPDQAAAIAATYAQEPWRYEAEARAGWPTCVHSRPFPSDTGRYCGYYVGGGAARHGEGPYDHEGTWGWDYLGYWLPRRVALGWSHGRRQSGMGAYQTDGPKLIHRH